MEKGIVYICHHIDTEGPLWEVISELFERLKLIFGIDLEPTYENLERLQKGDIDVPETTSGGICRIATSTGDINISII